MIDELRIYHILPGRMEAINARFRDHTLGLFEKHGIKVTSFWVDATGKEKLYYTCRFESTEAQAAAWAAFRVDPAWIAARDKSEESGAIVDKVESFTMSAAPYFKG